MASGAYSFLDIAVLDRVRERFAAGDALLVLGTDLGEVIWANGPGAAILGFRDIEAAMGASASLGAAASRQIRGTSGFPEIGRDRPIAVRLSSGLKSRTASFLASSLKLPDGEPAILLADPALSNASRTPRDIAQRAISGFSQPGHYAAILDAEGGVTASSPGFASVALPSDILRTLAHEVRDESDRLVKRLVAADNARLPAGIARLTDEPALHLLIVVDEDQGSDTEDEAPAPGTRQADEPEAKQGPEAPQTPPGRPDDWYFNGGPERRAPAEPETTDEEANAGDDDLPAPVASSPVRFIWRTDTDGRFSTFSHEFADAVGRNAADVIGRSFRDVATVFGFDPEGEIAGLLARRDTWSGRTVLWPIAGTDLKVPVDLAALPVYRRDGTFEGFRGFGVARMGDAIVDEEAIGMALTETPAPASHKDAGKPGTAEDDPEDGPAVTEPPEPAPQAQAGQDAAEEKVIRLSERRAPSTGSTLSPVEHSAFREIGDRLKLSGEESNRTAAPDGEAETDIGEDIETEPASGETPPTTVFEGEAESEPAAADEPALSVEEADEKNEDDDAFDAGSDGDGRVQPEQPDEALDETDAAHDRADVVPSAFALPRWVREQDTFDVAVLEYLPVPILIHAGDRLHYANREFLELTGYASVADLAMAGGLDALFDEPYERPETGDKTVCLRTRSGDELPVGAFLQSVPWRNGKALLLALKEERDEPAAPETVSENGVSPQQVPEAEARRTESLEAHAEELRTIIDTATDGVIIIDNDGDITSVSRPAEALFGYEPEDVVGKPFASLFAIESQRAARDYLSGLSDNGVASVLNDGREVIGREAQGRFIPMFMTIGRLPREGGFCAVLRDITQWKRAEEELTQARAQAERASSQKTEFLARVSHEIRTPLNAIIGFSELMIDEKFGPLGSDRYRDYLRDINRSGNHVLDLVNDLLDISKIEAGQQDLSFEAVSLNDVLAETVAMMQPQANRERVIIRSSYASRLPDVVADMRSARQIALNLLANAVRYTKAGGQVIVSTIYESSGDITMRVRDTGVGMSGAEIEQAMKPFKQINALRRARGDGTGLGLPLTKALVEANRARFSISSVPGEGTLVEIGFPSTRVLAD